MPPHAHPRVVLIYKRYGAGGYYIDLSTDALVQQGIDVAVETQLRIRHVLRSGPGHIIHLQFPEELYKGASRVSLLARSFRVLFLLLTLRVRGARLFWTFHDDIPHESVLIPLVDRVMRRVLALLCDVIIVHSTYAAHALRRLYVPNAQVVRVPLGNMVGFFPHETVAKGEARRRLGIAADRRVYLFFGRMRWYKGVDDLITAFRKLQRADAILLLADVPAGRTWDLASTRRMFIELVGNDPRIIARFEWIPREEVALYFRAADVAVFPFRRVTTSATVVTALSFGLPIIAPRIGSMPEMVTEDAGRLYDVSAPGALTQALDWAYTGNLERSAAAARRRAEKDTWDSFGREMAVLYRSLVTS